MRFESGNISTNVLFGNPVNYSDFGDVGKGRFTKKVRVRIASLQPRQEFVSGDTLNYKLKGKGYTVPFVIIDGESRVLIDGHHTTIAKKMRGQKFIFAMCYIYNPLY